jgi:hypothetical protein
VAINSTEGLTGRIEQHLNILSQQVVEFARLRRQANTA